MSKTPTARGGVIDETIGDPPVDQEQGGARWGPIWRRDVEGRGRHGKVLHIGVSGAKLTIDGLPYCETAWRGPQPGEKFCPECLEYAQLEIDRLTEALRVAETHE